MSDTLAALEVALARSPDDVVLLSALADYFLEDGDPRGDYLKRRLDGDTADAMHMWNAHNFLDLAPLWKLDPRALPIWHYCWIRGVLLAQISPAILDAIAVHPLLVRLAARRAEDETIDHLAASGLLLRLAHLSLQNGFITDDGAESLAAFLRTHQHNLATLDLANNLLSPIGVGALADAGFPRVGPQQYFNGIDRNPEGDDVYV